MDYQDYQDYDYDDYVEDVIDFAIVTSNIFAIKEKLNLSDEEFEKALESLCI